MATPPDFTAGQVLTAAQMDAIGAWLITSGTFSAASTVTADNVFTSDYLNYKIVCRYTTSTTNNVLAKVRVGGVSAATNYNFQQISGVSTSITGARTTAATQWTLADQSNGDYKSLFIMDLSGPAVAEPTIGWVDNASNVGGYNLVRANVTALNHSTATAYDGLELFVSTGTFTGSYAIYGLRN